MSRPVTLITGASAGLGAEFARLCAGRARRCSSSRAGVSASRYWAAELGGAEILEIDLAAPGASARLVAEVAARGLHVDRLINNAGFGLVGRFAALPLARQREMIDLNIGALTELAHLVLPGMIARGRGGILNVASTAAFQAGPGFAVYFASKAFVLSFSEALHQELKGKGIKVSALCPGPTATEFGAVAGYKGSVPDFMSADARSVCLAGLNGLDRNRAIVVPGLLNKATAQSNRFFPRALIRRVVARLKG